ncbi:MAG: cell division protein SepF [Clostridia bacterium]|nr:cell division protein SepF [Clostridia bacterium]
MGFWDNISTGLGLLERNEEYKEKKHKLNSRVPVEKVLQNKVAICKPRSFRDIVQFVNKLRENIPIIVNFTELNIDEVERSLDFVCGAVCALDGVLERIGDGIYFYAPPNMRVEN